MKVSGIYCLINKINGKAYIGQSVDICNRFSTEHKSKISKTLKERKQTEEHVKNRFANIMHDSITGKFISIKNKNGDKS